MPPSNTSVDFSSSCRICGSNSIRAYLQVPDNGHLRTAEVQLSVWCCEACDICFLNPFPAPELGARYFAESYKAENKSLYYDDEFKARVSRVRLDILRKRHPSARTLLDVGCGKGQFVAVARQDGWEAWGVELDAGAVATAQSRGLHTVLQGSVDHASLPEAFDVITLWDVIEHLQNPASLLGDIYKRLAPGGLIAVRTANIRSALFARNPKKWWAFGVDHRFYFSPRSLTQTLNTAGYSVKEILDLERVERPEKRRLSLLSNPKQIPRHLRNLARYGKSYRSSLMTCIAEKPL